MNFDILQWNWTQLTAKIKEKYADLTDDEIGEMEASAENFGWILQEKYWWTKEELEQKVKELEDEIQQ